ncbi:hypothetical protein [Okeania sp. KiyG1]|uniref:hypothetical protein n=1 Tax=Okeania sp. KiyG1 TaxID=2720165 RepID=UPI0019234648|nr:hypothetical protein [Okeania sp. KiyG1]GGA36792.1 hypothetical protein CYANOKiyG1_54780 [Okeania sp. KiyG1]
MDIEHNPEDRLSVGYSIKGKNDYQLELRIEQKGGKAYKFAEKKAEKFQNEIDLLMVEDVTIPSSTVLIQSAIDGKGNNSFTRKKRPLHLGLSVGHRDGGPGTLGAFVCTSNGSEAILSNNHVLALCDEAKPGDKIYQPGRLDQRSIMTMGSYIGTLGDAMSISKIGSNFGDSAYAVLDKGIEHQGNLIPSGFGNSDDSGRYINDVQDYDVISPEIILAKIGRTTGYTEGIPGAIELDNVAVYIPQFKQNVRFDNLLEIRWQSTDKPFAEKGDSGSLIFIPKILQAVGLQFASGILDINGKKVGVSYACNLKNILETLDLTFIS